MSAHHPTDVNVCGAPTLYSIVANSRGGFTVLTSHRCRIVPVCVTLNLWGPFEDLELAEQARRLLWPSAVPGTAGDFPITRA